MGCPQGNCQAVVVERTHFLREKLAALLARAGWHVAGAVREGWQGLDIVRTCRPELVVLDLALGDMPGTELIRRIKAEVPSCRVVVCTALVEARWVKAAVEAGADDFVVKPVDDDRFLAAVNGEARVATARP